MKRIETWLFAVTRTLDIIGGWIILPMISIVVLIDVILRYVFNSPYIWTLEFSEWWLLLVFAFAVPECTRRHGHIRMDLVYGVLPERLKQYFSVVYSALAIWLFYLLSRHEWEEFLYDYQFDRVTEYLQLPIWFHHVAMLIMSLILIVYFLCRGISSIFNLDSFTEEETGEYME
jgi:TRAP-type C4-dicarboxylate transport system permease small subunit